MFLDRFLTRRARALALGLFLIVGAQSGLPIRPQEIEEHLRSQTKAEVLQVLEKENQPPGADPPGDP